MTATPDTLLGQLAQGAAEVLAPKVQDGVQAGADKLVALINAHVGDMPEELQPLAAAGAQAIQANSDTISKAGANLFTAMVTHVALGSSDDAITAWIGAPGTTDAEVLAQLEKDAGAVQADNAATAAAKAAFLGDLRSAAEEFLKAAGTVGLSLLIKFGPAILAVV